MDDAQKQSFDFLMTRAGLDVPPERELGAFKVYRELSHMAELLRQPRAAESEPAAVFRLDTILPETGEL